MANYIVTPEMNLPNPVPGVDPGPDYANNIQASLNQIDQHNHSTGQGVQIQPNGLNISSDLPFNNNNATLLNSTRFISLLSPLTNSAPNVGCLYVSGNELYFNDYSGGHQVQITANGLVNATSSGISSGTASASFSAGTLVVKSSSTSYANIYMQSAVLALSGNLVNQLTLQAPSALSSGSYSITLPTIPAVKSIMALDASGNMSAPYTVDNSTIVISSNIIEVGALGITAAQIANATITATQIANATITATQIASATITGTQIVSNVNLAGTSVEAGGQKVIVASTNATNGLKIVRGRVAANGVIAAGEGFTVGHSGTGTYNISFSSVFSDTPANVVTASVPSSGYDNICTTFNASTTGFGLSIYSPANGTTVDSAFELISIGQR